MLNEFVDYVWQFYGDQGLYKDFFEDKPITQKELLEAATQISKLETWGGGDSFDRELVRDYMLLARGHTDLEYGKKLQELLEEA